MSQRNWPPMDWHSIINASIALWEQRTQRNDFTEDQRVVTTVCQQQLPSSMKDMNIWRLWNRNLLCQKRNTECYTTEMSFSITRCPIARHNKRSWRGHLFKDLVLCWHQVCISFFFLTSVFIITWKQVNKVESICVQGLTCVLIIDNIEHLYSSNTANLHIYFLLVWVIECLITGLKLKMAYLWLQSLMQSIDLKSSSATRCLMIVSVCTNTCYYIFFCIIKTLQNVKFMHVYKSPVIRAEAT